VRRRPRVEREPRERRVRRWHLPILILALVGSGAFYVLASRHRAAPLLSLMNGGQAPRRTAPVVLPVASEPLVVPRAAEIALERARALLASGHPRDALRLVEQVGAGDPARGEADALRAQIQAVLLSAAAPPPAPAPGESRFP